MHSMSRLEDMASLPPFHRIIGSVPLLVSPKGMSPSALISHPQMQGLESIRHSLIRE